MPESDRIRLTIDVRAGTEPANPDDAALYRWLWHDARLLLARMAAFEAEPTPVHALTKLVRSPQRAGGMLRSLRHAELADYLPTDRQGRWRRTKRGDEVVASWEGTIWMPS